MAINVCLVLMLELSVFIDIHAPKGYTYIKRYYKRFGGRIVGIRYIVIINYVIMGNCLFQ